MAMWRNLPWWAWLVIWLCILAVVIAALWAWKNVWVPTLTVTTDKDSYDRTELVQIDGDLTQGGSPLAGKTVSLVIQPPTGDAYALPDVVTDANGQYSATWDIPDDATGGTYTLTAGCLGVSASKTFRQAQVAEEG